MKRTTIHLTEQQRAAIKRLAKTTGLKPAEIVRRYIDAGLTREAKR